MLGEDNIINVKYLSQKGAKDVFSPSSLNSIPLSLFGFLNKHYVSKSFHKIFYLCSKIDR
jgi:hypothetical protein